MSEAVTQLQIRGWLGTRLSPELRDAYERAAERVKEPHAPNTRAAYRAVWRDWGNHCAALGLDPSPPFEPLFVIGYLESLTSGGRVLRNDGEPGRQKLELAPNTVRLHLAALCSLDEAEQAASGAARGKFRHHPVIVRWLKSWATQHPIAPRKRAQALTPRELERVVNLAAEPGHNQSRIAHAARYARDRCMLVLGTAAAVRVSELSALDVRDVFESAEGLTVFVRRSKSDQHGKGHTRGLHPQARRVVCPLEAWRQWMQVRGTSPGALFVPIARNGLLELEQRLPEQACMRVITSRCQAAGLEHVTSHSLRRTFATLSKHRPTVDVMRHGNWKSAQVVAGYQDDGKLFENSPTRGLFDSD